MSRVASFADGQDVCSGHAALTEQSHAESDKSVGDSCAESLRWLARHRDVDSFRRELCRLEAIATTSLSHMKAKLPIGRQSWLLKVSLWVVTSLALSHTWQTQLVNLFPIAETGAQPHTAQSQTLSNSLTRLFRSVCLTWKHPLACKKADNPTRHPRNSLPPKKMQRFQQSPPCASTHHPEKEKDV